MRPAGTRSAAAVRERPIPWRDLPMWLHPEHGAWKPATAEPYDESDMFYSERLEALLDRRWPEFFPDTPTPERRFCLMQPEDGSSGWCAVAMLAFRIPSDDRGLLDALENANRMQVSHRGYYAYLSPFFDWALADYWESGCYDA